jgi:hypothetical protein
MEQSWTNKWPNLGRSDRSKAEVSKGQMGQQEVHGCIKGWTGLNNSHNESITQDSCHIKDQEQHKRGRCCSGFVVSPSRMNGGPSEDSLAASIARLVISWNFRSSFLLLGYLSTSKGKCDVLHCSKLPGCEKNHGFGVK